MTNPHQFGGGFLFGGNWIRGYPAGNFVWKKGRMTLIGDERIQTKFELESHSEGNLIYYENKQ